MNIIKPDIYDKFECAGKDCIFTCCGGWGIPIEEEIYTKCSEYKENTEYDSELGIYKIKMNGRGMCPFLDEDQLCTLVLGEKDLGETCRKFPRICTVTTEKEKSLMLDCPQAVALLEKLKEPISFVTESGEKSGCSEEEKAKYPELNDSMILIRNIRVRIMDWLQKRELPLWYRIFFGAFCLNRIDKMTEWSGIKSEIEKMLSKEYYEAMLVSINRITFDKYKQFEEIRNIIIQLNGFLLCPLMDDKSGSRNKAIRLMAKNQDCSFEEYEELCVKWKNDKETEFDILLEKVIAYQWFQYSAQGNCKDFMYHNFLAIILEFLLIRRFSILSYSVFGKCESEEMRFIIALASRAGRIRKNNHDYNEWIEEMEKGSLSIANLYCLLR